MQGCDTMHEILNASVKKVVELPSIALFLLTHILGLHTLYPLITIIILHFVPIVGTVSKH